MFHTDGEKIASNKESHYSETIKEVRKQRDSAMEEVNKLHQTIQTMKVQSSVMSATKNLDKSNPSSSSAAVSNSMRSALEKEFEEKKKLMEQRWDHALQLVTDQMKKQRDEQVQVCSSERPPPTRCNASLML